MFFGVSVAKWESWKKISQSSNNFSFLSISAANYTGKSMKEIPIINNSNSNYDPAKEADPCEEIDEQITNKSTSGKPFLNLNYK